MTSKKTKQDKRFFSRLNYSFGNEDWQTEKEALQIEPNNRVICITASGDRPLHLLLDDCKNLTSVDANPIQNHLLNLKCAAIQSLEYEEYLGFLGAISHDSREKTFRKVFDALHHDSAQYWLNNLKMIRKGILYQGNIERLTKLVTLAFNLARPRKIKQLFTMNDLEEQRKFLKTKWDTFFIRKVFDIALSRFLSNMLEIDPGLHTNLDPSICMGSYIYSRILKSLNQGLAKENLLISLIFRGFVGREAFPPYLKAEGFHTIKKRLSRISFRTQNVIDYLANSSANSYDRFSLSDVASYMNQEEFHHMIKNVYHAAKPGARFCIRQFSSNHKIPKEFEANFQREAALEQKLEHDDRCFLYRFMVGRIHKPSC